MKFVWIIGNAAVGKMTVGQELSKITDLRLFHNHMSIELVIDVFGSYIPSVIGKMRDLIFEEFAATDQKGMIFTYMWAFDHQGDWNYVKRVSEIFEKQGAEIYYVELVAPQAVRLQRNETENRLRHKGSKRDVEASNQRLLNDDLRFRCESFEGEITFANYMKIDNSELTPEEVAQKIQNRFNL